MGYMGFGMKKEVYTRKPKKAFVKLKSIYGSELQKRTGYEKKKVQKLSSRERVQIKKRVKRKFYTLQLKSAAISLAILIALIWLTVYVVLPFLFHSNIPKYINGQVKREVIENSGVYSKIEIEYYESGVAQKMSFYNAQHKLCKQITRDTANTIIAIREW